MGYLVCCKIGLEEKRESLVDWRKSLARVWHDVIFYRYDNISDWLENWGSYCFANFHLVLRNIASVSKYSNKDDND